MPMVKYWKSNESLEVKRMVSKDGSLIMRSPQEDYDFPGFPRTHSLFSTLSKLKHEVKNQVFNESWELLEQGKNEEAIAHIKKTLTGKLTEYMDACRYDMLPPEKMVPPVRELWRVLSKMELKEPKLKFFKEYLTFLCQEDDGYRFRLQWLVSLFWWVKPKDIKLALEELENAEVVDDMKGFARLWKRIILIALEDPYINYLFEEFCKEINWKKLKLSKGDLYHFRAKWFKADWLLFEY